MSSLCRCLIAGLFSTIALYGQSLGVASSRTEGKTGDSFSVMMESPRGKAPVALQWEFAIPPAVAVTLADITIGAAAEAARKTLTCAMTSNKAAVPGGARYACILAGGQQPIGNGCFVKVRFRLQEDVAGAPIRLAMEHVQGASADPKLIALQNVDVILHIE